MSASCINKQLYSTSPLATLSFIMHLVSSNDYRQHSVQESLSPLRLLIQSSQLILRTDACPKTRKCNVYAGKQPVRWGFL